MILYESREAATQGEADRRARIVAELHESAERAHQHHPGERATCQRPTCRGRRAALRGDAAALFTSFGPGGAL